MRLKNCPAKIFEECQKYFKLCSIDIHYRMSVSDGVPCESEATCDNSSIDSNISYINVEIKERNLAGLIHIPDIDDTSMGYVFRYVEYYQEDLCWSFTSDSLFLIGGSTCIILRIWEYVDDVSQVVFQSLTIFISVVYLLNSIVDIWWSSRLKRRQKIRNLMTRLWTKEKENLRNNANDTSVSEKNMHPNETKHPQMQSEACFKQAFLQLLKVRKHAAHRRTVFAAIAFGAAALSEVVATFIAFVYGDVDACNWCHAASVHLYIVSATISISGKRTRPWLEQKSCVENHETLEDLGDLLFFLGSVLDGALLDSPWGDYHGKTWAIVSAIFWFLDACLYFFSDVSEACKYGRRHGKINSDTQESTFYLI
jgi:hypothetical protein